MKYQIKVMHREMNWQCSANNNMFKMFQKLEHIGAVYMPSFRLHHSSLGHIENYMLRTAAIALHLHKAQLKTEQGCSS